MITRERMGELLNQATDILVETESEAQSIGVDPDTLAEFYRVATSIGDRLDLPCDQRMSYCFIVGVLVGREQ